MRLRLCFVVVMVAGCGPRELRVTMNSDNNSGQSGFAVITDKGNSVTVTVETSAPDFGDTQQMHIHRGNCGEVEPIYADLLNLMPLKDKPGRVGSTSPEVLKRQPAGAKVQFEDFAEGEWLINVHDARDTLIYVSCGEFSSGSK